MQSFGKFFVIIGIVFLIAGALFTLFPKTGLFKLPGDIVIKKGNVNIFVPVVSSIVLSLLITVILWLINYFWKR